MVLEERRQRVEVAPLGKFQEAFAFKGFKTNYRRPVIGYESDIRNTSRRDVEKFFKKFYNPHRCARELQRVDVAAQVVSLGPSYTPGTIHAG